MPRVSHISDTTGGLPAEDRRLALKHAVDLQRSRVWDWEIFVNDLYAEISTATHVRDRETAHLSQLEDCLDALGDWRA